jgi:hypothetical protein
MRRCPLLFSFNLKLNIENIEKVLPSILKTTKSYWKNSNETCMPSSVSI